MNKEPKKGWSASGNLLAGGSLGVGLAANFDEPGPYTLQFTRRFVASPVFPIYTLAELIWSVEGNSARRLISVDTGIAISGNGQGVTVKVFDWSGVALLASNLRYDLDITCVKGLRGSNVQRPFLEVGAIDPTDRGSAVRELVAASSSVDFPVPRNAGINSLRINIGGNTGSLPVLTGGIRIAYFAGTTTLRIRQAASITDLLLLNWEPLPPGCDRIRITNGAGNDTISVTITWGIEG